MNLKWWQYGLVIFLSVDLIILNYFVYRLLYQSRPIANPSTKIVTNVIYPTDVPLPTASPVPTDKPITTSSPRRKVRNISYLPISTGGSTLSNDWVSLAGTQFYFDKADYPGLIEIYFEVNAHLFNGNGTAFVRLYDDNHGIGVQGSDVQTNNQADTAVVSGKVSFYSGKNLVKVQLKSLTADTAVFTSGRLRIVTEN